MTETRDTAQPHKENRKLLVVEREPTPYKVDLWNACTASGRLSIRVLFSTQRDWSPDLGHFYEEFPPMRFWHERIRGRASFSTLRFAVVFLRQFFSWRPHAVYIAGYSHLPGLLVVAVCALSCTPYFMASDALNMIPATTFYTRCRHAFRNAVRRFVFRTTKAMLVCGTRGRSSTLAAGCPAAKVVDFPYVVDAARMHEDVPSTIPPSCQAHLAAGKTILFFSGRMIARKGLATLLRAAASLHADASWVLWCEGEGPDRSTFEHMARTLGIANRCLFLGFCQMSLHSWLIRNAEIIVVPSLDDRWGIVVDEGMQLGKVVVSTNETGSAEDRIVSGRNGIRIAAGDEKALSQALKRLMADANAASHMAAEAARTADRYTPLRNAAILATLVNCDTN
jgi:glycosyltransferase involved in cell wall biosynthesis